jgi:hypothetical protein
MLTHAASASGEQVIVHYHMVCEGEVAEAEVRVVWCRATDALDDASARKYAAKVDAIRKEAQVRKYLGSYIGKLRQKLLPVGVDGAGRWWGASRSIRLVVLDELVSCELKGRRPKRPETLAVRCIRKFISRLVGFEFKGGVLIDWKGTTCERVSRALVQLRAFYGSTETNRALPERTRREEVAEHE